MNIILKSKSASKININDSAVGKINIKDGAEARARKAADAMLQGNIDAEATARAAADTTLQGNIDAEAAAREAAIEAACAGKVDDTGGSLVTLMGEADASGITGITRKWSVLKFDKGGSKVKIPAYVSDLNNDLGFISQSELDAEAAYTNAQLNKVYSNAKNNGIIKFNIIPKQWNIPLVPYKNLMSISVGSNADLTACAAYRPLDASLDIIVDSDTVQSVGFKLYRMTYIYSAANADIYDEINQNCVIKRCSETYRLKDFDFVEHLAHTNDNNSANNLYICTMSEQDFIDKGMPLPTKNAANEAANIESPLFGPIIYSALASTKVVDSIDPRLTMYWDSENSVYKIIIGLYYGHKWSAVKNFNALFFTYGLENPQYNYFNEKLYSRSNMKLVLTNSDNGISYDTSLSSFYYPSSNNGISETVGMIGDNINHINMFLGDSESGSYESGNLDTVYTDCLEGKLLKYKICPQVMITAANPGSSLTNPAAMTDATDKSIYDSNRPTSGYLKIYSGDAIKQQILIQLRKINTVSDNVTENGLYKAISDEFYLTDFSATIDASSSNLIRYKIIIKESYFTQNNLRLPAHNDASTLPNIYCPMMKTVSYDTMTNKASGDSNCVLVTMYWDENTSSYLVFIQGYATASYDKIKKFKSSFLCYELKTPTLEQFIERPLSVENLKVSWETVTGGMTYETFAFKYPKSAMDSIQSIKPLLLDVNAINNFIAEGNFGKASDEISTSIKGLPTDGASDSSEAIQTALNGAVFSTSYLTGTKTLIRRITIPAGVYTLNDSIKISNPYTEIVGDGKVVLCPSGCFPAIIMNASYCNISNLTFYLTKNNGQETDDGSHSGIFIGPYNTTSTKYGNNACIIDNCKFQGSYNLDVEGFEYSYGIYDKTPICSEFMKFTNIGVYSLYCGIATKGSGHQIDLRFEVGENIHSQPWTTYSYKQGLAYPVRLLGGCGNEISFTGQCHGNQYGELLKLEYEGAYEEYHNGQSGYDWAWKTVKNTMKAVVYIEGSFNNIHGFCYDAHRTDCIFNIAAGAANICKYDFNCDTFKNFKTGGTTNTNSPCIDYGEGNKLINCYNNVPFAVSDFALSDKCSTVFDDTKTGKGNIFNDSAHGVQDNALSSLSKWQGANVKFYKLGLDKTQPLGEPDEYGNAFYPLTYTDYAMDAEITNMFLNNFDCTTLTMPEDGSPLVIEVNLGKAIKINTVSIFFKSKLIPISEAGVLNDWTFPTTLGWGYKDTTGWSMKRFEVIENHASFIPFQIGRAVKSKMKFNNVDAFRIIIYNDPDEEKRFSTIDIQQITATRDDGVGNTWLATAGGDMYGDIFMNGNILNTGDDFDHIKKNDGTTLSSALSSKINSPIISNIESSNIAINLADFNNIYARCNVSPANIIFTFGDEYPDDYTAGLSFTAGATSPTISYASSGILNWLGTDCELLDGRSIFAPSPNYHYDIVFCYNGSHLIGRVEGFLPATIDNLDAQGGDNQ